MMTRPMMTLPRMMALGVATLLGLAGCADSQEPASPQTQAAPSGKAGANGQAQSDQRVVSVTVAPVTRQSVQPWIYSQGTARSRQREFLTFTQAGVVSHVDPTLRVGSPVKTGQVIAHQAPERVRADLQAARASVAEAQANLALANVTQQRYETLIQQRSASQQEMDEAAVKVQQARAARDNARAQLAQAQLDVNESRLVSPMDGVLARLNVERGRYFAPNTVQTNTEQNALRTVPAMVIDPNRFEVRVDLPSYNFRQIAPGARAVIGGHSPVDAHDIDPQDGDSGRVTGQIHAISPSLDPETRTFEVIVHTEGDNPGLQDGEFVAVWLAQPGQEDALAVPLDALRFRNDQAFVFVADEATGKVQERRVELGQQSGRVRVVTQGLEEGERVVTDGRAALHDGQQVRILQAAGAAA